MVISCLFLFRHLIKREKIELCKVNNRIIYSDEIGNEIRFSSVRTWNGPAKFAGMSSKFVLQGTEVYQTSEKKYAVTEGEYLLGNQKTESLVSVHSNTEVLGLCIDISENLVKTICQKWELTEDFFDYLFNQQLLVNKYNKCNSLLGKELETIANSIHQRKAIFIDKSLFYTLATALVEDQIKIYQNYGRLNFKKQYTKKEVFSQLMHGKDFMERNWNKILDLETISKEAGMSKYHFARLFRDVFGLSPYQFFIALKMKNALSILSEGKTIQSTSELLGYPDVSSFSKAFSKFYGLPPSLHQKIA